MEKKRRKIMIYIILVILPSLLFSLIFSKSTYNTEKAKTIDHAKWIASVHEQQMDKIIGETSKTLEVLAITLKHDQVITNHLKSELQDIKYKNPLYGGLYLFDPTGNFIVGTNDDLKNYDIHTKRYIEEIKLTHQTAVSDQEETLLNQEHIIAISTPILRNNIITGILITHL
jgi:two-component system, sporulation sensor kinase D